jgi:MFS family permease
MQLKRRKNTRASKAFAVIWTFYYMSLVYETSTCLLGGNFFQYFDHKVLSYEQQGILLMLPFLIIGTLELFFSQLTEIMGRRKAIFIGALFTASAYVGISQWQAFYRLMLCMFSLGVGISLLSGAFRAWTNTALDDLNQGHRRVHESVYIHYAALLLGSLGSVYLLSRKSSYTFLVSGVLLIVGELRHEALRDANPLL